jgi:Domain of unknown function (DUF222)
MVMDNDTLRANTSGLPPDLETMVPGPRLAVLLAGVDRSRLSDHDLVRLMVARDRLASHIQAQRAADIAEVTRRCGDDDVTGEFAALEVGAALRLTRAAAQHEVAFAADVLGRLPRIGDLLGSGRIDGRRARVLADGTAHLDQQLARRVVADVADLAGDLTTGQLRALLRKLCLTADPEDTAKRLQRAVEDRRVVLEATSAGSANLVLLDLSPDLAAAAREHIDFLARMLPGGDERTMDQRRADVAVDLLCGHSKPVGRGMVDVTVDLRTLLGLTADPGELGGWGPVVADIARQVVDRQRDGRWQATVIDDNGDPHAVAVRRRPTMSQYRQVRARHRTCVFPGCRRPARASDLDHTTRFVDAGPTLERNLAPLCRFHHRAKETGRWRYRRRPNGDHLWTSPHGHTYVNNGRSP